MSKKKYLTNAEKEIIAYLYRKKLSIGKIAYVLGRHRRTIFNYKNYKLPRTVKERKDIPDITKDKDEIIDMYTRPTNVDGRTLLEETAYRKQMKRKHHG